MDPVCITSDSKEKDMAMVACPDAEVYISRDGEGQRSCEFVLQWWDDKESKTQVFEFRDRDKAIAKFLRLIKRRL